MAVIDFDTYREVLGEDQVKLQGVSYPVKRLSFREVVEVITAAAALNPRNVSEVSAFAERFSELTGVPMKVLESLTSPELGSLIRFFVEAQQETSEAHGKALEAAVGLASTS